VSLDAAIRELVLSAVRDALPEVRAEFGRPRLISIRELPVSHRLVLEAEHAGEIRVYRRGKLSVVDEAEFVAWMKRSATPTKPPQPTADDEIGELIAANVRRRKPRSVK